MLRVCAPSLAKQLTHFRLQLRELIKLLSDENVVYFIFKGILLDLQMRYELLAKALHHKKGLEIIQF